MYIYIYITYIYIYIYISECRGGASCATHGRLAVGSRDSSKPTRDRPSSPRQCRNAAV